MLNHLPSVGDLVAVSFEDEVDGDLVTARGTVSGLGPIELRISPAVDAAGEPILPGLAIPWDAVRSVDPVPSDLEARRAAGRRGDLLCALCVELGLGHDGDHLVPTGGQR